MPDITNASYYYQAEFSKIPQASVKSILYYDECFSDVVSQWGVSLSSLNILETGAENELILQQCETPRKKLIHQQLPNSYTFHSGINLCEAYSCAHYPEEIVICGEPGKENLEVFKCAAQLHEQLRLVGPVGSCGTEEQTDGSSTSKSSSSCGRSDISYSSTYEEHSRKTFRRPTYESTNAGDSECRTGGNKGQTECPTGKHPTRNSSRSPHKCMPRENESFRPPNKLFNSECPHSSSKEQHSEKPRASTSKVPHASAAASQGDTSKYDDTARLEIYKLRHRIKRFTEGLDGTALRKSHTYPAQNLDFNLPKVLKSKTQPVPDCKSCHRDATCSKTPFQRNVHSPLVQKSVPQMLPSASVRKKKRNFEIFDQMLETQTETVSCTASPTLSVPRTRELSGDITNRTEPFRRHRDTQHPTHLDTTRNVYRKEHSSGKSVPQHALVENQTDTAEHCRNCRQHSKAVKRSQLRRPVPGQRPLYNYDHLSYQASEVYPDLLCELEEKLSALSSRDASGKSVGTRPKQRLEDFF